MAALALHLYGVVPAGAPLPTGLRGRRDRPVRGIADQDLQALVSEVEEDARVGREDLLSHARVLESLAAAGTTVIPVQFGMLLPDDGSVERELLGAQKDTLRSLVGLFDGLVQLTVQAAHIEDEALREVLRRDPDLVRMRDALAGRAHDTAGQMRLGEVVAAGLERLRDEDAVRVVEAVAPQVRAVAEQETRGNADVANLALLVARDSRDGLDRAVEALDRELGRRVRLRYVGPQPPYAFLDAAVSGRLAWA